MVVYNGTTKTAYQLSNTSDSSPVGLYRHTLRDADRYKLGCGVTLSAEEDLKWPEYFVHLNVIILINSSLMVIESCPDQADNRNCWEQVSLLNDLPTAGRPRVYYGYYVDMTLSKIRYLGLDTADQTTVFCDLRFRETGDMLRNSAKFDWWELPTKLEMTPTSINGYHRQDHLIVINCTSIGGHPANPDLDFTTCLEDACDSEENSGYGYEDNKYINGFSAIAQLQLDHYWHHGKQ